MPTSRDLVRQALDFHTPARVPKDLGGMRSTCISAFAYPKLVAALGLPPRLPRVEDTGQMLALPDLDVLDALGVDVVTILDGVTNALPVSAQADLWHAYDFNGRLPAQVRWPQNFQTMPDGAILQQGRSRMVLDSFVFDDEHGGQALDLSDDLPKYDLKQFRKEVEAGYLRDEQVKAIRELCKRVREASDRAVFFNDGSIQAWMGIGSHGGVAIFPMLCITEPDYVAELHEIVTERSLYNARQLLPEIREYVDVAMMTADDWGTQNNLFASPKVYRKLFLPYYQRINAACHQLAPEIKLFMHNCGAVYDLIDMVVESGFDILNPVQWPAGGHSYREWKDKARGRVTLWGGGVNAQATLPLGTMEDVSREVSQVVDYMGQDGGYIFCNIHNILAEITPEKVIAMYRAAGDPMAIKIAVVTGGHSFDVEAFHELFRSLPGIEAYIQHLDDFASSPEAVRDRYAAVVFYMMPLENPLDEGLPWYCGKPKAALEHLGSVQQGIVLLHHGIVAYPGWPVWDQIAGVSGRVNASYHFDQRIPVEIAAPEHPILRGLTPWTISDESYVIPDFHPAGQILLTTSYIPSWSILAWARTYRKARVFCYQSGHDSKTYADPSFRKVLMNGILWTVE